MNLILREDILAFNLKLTNRERLFEMALIRGPDKPATLQPTDAERARVEPYKQGLSRPALICPDKDTITVECFPIRQRAVLSEVSNQVL